MVIGSYYPEVTGGAVQCRLLVKTLKEKVRFLVLTTTRNIVLHRWNKVDGVDVIRIPIWKENRVDYFNAFFKFISFFLYHRKDFQIVHLHGFTAKSILLVFLSKLFHKKIIIKMSSIGHDDPLAMRNRGFFLHHFFSKANAYVGVSKQFKSIYRDSDLPADRFRLIPNGVDTGKFFSITRKEKKRLREQLGLPLQLKMILFVGHFSIDKCPDVLIKTWKEYVADAYPDSGVVLIGTKDPVHYEVDADVVKKVKRLAKTYHGKRVFFVERTHEIEKYYQAADIFVMPSLREGLPNAMLEAMSCELPVIVSELEGVTDWVVEDGVNGLLISPGSEVELSDAIIRLLSNSNFSIELGKIAGKTIVERFSIEEIAKQYKKLYMNSIVSCKQ